MWSALSVRGSRVALARSRGSCSCAARGRLSFSWLVLSRLVRAARVDLSRLSRVALVRVVGSRSCAARVARSRGSLVRGRLMPLSFVLGSLSLSRGAALVAQQRVPLVARGSCGSRSCSLALVALMPLSFVVGARGSLSLSCGSWCRSRAARGSLVRVALSRSFSWLVVGSRVVLVRGAALVRSRGS